MTLPPATISKLQASHPEGTRHQVKLELALEMLGNGLPESAVEVTLAEKFPSAAQREIADVIAWAAAHNPGPSAEPGSKGFNPHLRNGFFHRDPSRLGGFHGAAPPPPSKPKPSAAVRACEGWLNGRLVTEEDLIAASPVKPDCGDFTRNARLLMESLYSSCDCLNIVCAHTVNNHGKANPKGAGKCLSACKWCEWLINKGVPQMRAGAWLRPNPVKETGSGARGAIMDADVVAPRFLLLESDCLPLSLQLTALASFRLPVAAIITSGCSSYHAWLDLNCHDLEEYAVSATRILNAAAKFGFDAANKNPSRLSRLPGAFREIRKQGDGRQRLIYLNPSAKWRPIL